jgi:hypothetical protein
MGLFNRKNADTPEAREYRAAKADFAADPVKRGEAGYVDIDSPAGRANLARQDRLARAEAAHKAAKRRS